MKIRDIFFTILLASGSMLVIPACVKTDEEQSKRDQEQRYFDLYLGANFPDATPQPSGLYFIEHKAGTGTRADEDDWLLINHVCYTIPGENIYETYLENVALDNNLHDSAALYGPYKIQNGTRNEGFTEGLSLMKEGGQATLLFTSDLGYGSTGLGKSVSPYQSLKYEVELLEVIKDIESYEQARFTSYVDTLTNADTIYDPDSESFMYYVIDKPTEGTQVAVDSMVEVAYTGYLLDGRIFAHKDADDPEFYEIKENDSERVMGWQLGILRLKEGEKARFIIPYQLGYGAFEFLDPESKLRVVPPYETLLYEVEILKVITTFQSSQEEEK